MSIFRPQSKTPILKLIIHCFILTIVSMNLIVPPSYAQMILALPPVGQSVPLTGVYAPPLMIGLTPHVDNPFLFEFLIHRGDAGLEGQAFKSESEKLIKYFLTALTIPDDQGWVNLSPYEKGRIMPDALSQTGMGKAMLEQDYMLKQLSASLTDPNKEIGKKFWDKVYKRAYEEYGVSQVPMSTFNKVWIVPSQAKVLEQDGSVLVLNRHMNVMLEEDFLALEENQDNARFRMGEVEDQKVKQLSQVSSDVFNEVIIPELEKEVNQGESFAALRQVYNAVILAAWYKQTLKDGLLGQVYMNQSKIAGVDLEDKTVKDRIYEQYIQAFRKGVYNFIKADKDLASGQEVPRKYFSDGIPSLGDNAMLVLQKVVGIEGLGPTGVRTIRKYFTADSGASLNPVLLVRGRMTETLGEKKLAQTVAGRTADSAMLGTGQKRELNKITKIMNQLNENTSSFQVMHDLLENKAITRLWLAKSINAARLESGEAELFSEDELEQVRTVDLNSFLSRVSGTSWIQRAGQLLEQMLRQKELYTPEAADVETILYLIDLAVADKLGQSKLAETPVDELFPVHDLEGVLILNRSDTKPFVLPKAFFHGFTQLVDASVGLLPITQDGKVLMNLPVQRDLNMDQEPKWHVIGGHHILQSNQKKESDLQTAMREMVEEALGNPEGEERNRIEELVGQLEFQPIRAGLSFYDRRVIGSYRGTVLARQHERTAAYAVLLPPEIVRAVNEVIGKKSFEQTEIAELAFRSLTEVWRNINMQGEAGFYSTILRVFLADDRQTADLEKQRELFSVLRTMGVGQDTLTSISRMLQETATVSMPQLTVSTDSAMLTDDSGVTNISETIEAHNLMQKALTVKEVGKSRMLVVYEDIMPENFKSLGVAEVANDMFLMLDLFKKGLKAAEAKGNSFGFVLPKGISQADESELLDEARQWMFDEKQKLLREKSNMLKKLLSDLMLTISTSDRVHIVVSGEEDQDLFRKYGRESIIREMMDKLGLKEKGLKLGSFRKQKDGLPMDTFYHAIEFKKGTSQLEEIPVFNQVKAWLTEEKEKVEKLLKTDSDAAMLSEVEDNLKTAIALADDFLRQADTSEKIDWVLRDDLMEATRGVWGLIRGLSAEEEQKLIEDSFAEDRDGVSSLMILYNRIKDISKINNERDIWLRYEKTFYRGFVDLVDRLKEKSAPADTAMLSSPKEQAKARQEVAVRVEEQIAAINKQIAAINKKDKKAGLVPLNEFATSYLRSNLTQYHERRQDALPKSQTRIFGDNFIPTSGQKFSRDLVNEIMGVINNSDIEKQKDELLKYSSKKVEHENSGMNAGKGTSLGRGYAVHDWHGRKVGEIGAKGTDTGWINRKVMGRDKDGKPKPFIRTVTVTEYRLINFLADRHSFAKQNLAEVTSPDSIPSLTKILHKEFFFDSIDDRVKNKRTYMQMFEDHDNVFLMPMEENMQEMIPIILTETGDIVVQLTDKDGKVHNVMTPGGHGQIFTKRLYDAMDRNLEKDLITIQTIVNADGPNNRFTPQQLSYQAKNKIPIVIMNALRTPLDAKGGNKGIEKVVLKDGKVLQIPGIIELAEADTSEKSSSAFQTQGLTTGRIGEQLFNTNNVALNLTVLNPFLHALKGYLQEVHGEKEGELLFDSVVTGDLMDNPKDKVGQKVVQMETVMAMAIYKLNKWLEVNKRNKELYPELEGIILKLLGKRLVYNLVIDNPNDRSKQFMPVKFFWDLSLYFFSDHFELAVDFESQRLDAVNIRPGHLPGFDMNKIYKKDVNTRPALGEDVKLMNLDHLSVPGGVLVRFPNAVLKGKVAINNQSKKAVDLYDHAGDKGQALFELDADGRIVLDNVNVEISEDGAIVVKDSDAIVSDSAMLADGYYDIVKDLIVGGDRGMKLPDLKDPRFKSNLGENYDLRPWDLDSLGGDRVLFVEARMRGVPRAMRGLEAQRLLQRRIETTFNSDKGRSLRVQYRKFQDGSVIVVALPTRQGQIDRGEIDSDSAMLADMHDPKIQDQIMGLTSEALGINDSDLLEEALITGFLQRPLWSNEAQGVRFTRDLIEEFDDFSAHYFITYLDAMIAEKGRGGDDLVDQIEAFNNPLLNEVIVQPWKQNIADAIAEEEELQRQVDEDAGKSYVEVPEGQRRPQPWTREHVEEVMMPALDAIAVKEVTTPLALLEAQKEVLDLDSGQLTTVQKEVRNLMFSIPGFDVTEQYSLEFTANMIKTVRRDAANEILAMAFDPHRDISRPRSRTVHIGSSIYFTKPRIHKLLTKLSDPDVQTRLSQVLAFGVRAEQQEEVLKLQRDLEQIAGRDVSPGSVMLVKKMRETAKNLYAEIAMMEGKTPKEIQNMAILIHDLLQKSVKSLQYPELSKAILDLEDSPENLSFVSRELEAIAKTSYLDLISGQEQSVLRRVESQRIKRVIVSPSMPFVRGLVFTNQMPIDRIVIDKMLASPGFEYVEVVKGIRGIFALRYASTSLRSNTEVDLWDLRKKVNIWIKKRREELKSQAQSDSAMLTEAKVELHGFTFYLKYLPLYLVAVGETRLIAYEEGEPVKKIPFKEGVVRRIGATRVVTRDKYKYITREKFVPGNVVDEYKDRYEAAKGGDSAMLVDMVDPETQLKVEIRLFKALGTYTSKDIESALVAGFKTESIENLLAMDLDFSMIKAGDVFSPYRFLFSLAKMDNGKRDEEALLTQIIANGDKYLNELIAKPFIRQALSDERQAGDSAMLVTLGDGTQAEVKKTSGQYFIEAGIDTYLPVTDQGLIAKMREMQFPSDVQSATSDEKGGIDFNPQLLDLQIKRDGQGVPLPLPMQDLEQINIEGLYPVIINITPAGMMDIPFLMGMINLEAEITLSKR